MTPDNLYKIITSIWGLNEPRLVIFDSKDCIAEMAEKSSPLLKTSDLWLIIDHKAKYTSRKSKYLKTITIAPYELYKESFINGDIEAKLNPSSDFVIFLDIDSEDYDKDVQDFNIQIGKYLKGSKFFFSYVNVINR